MDGSSQVKPEILTAEYLRSRVSYDPASGAFVWLAMPGDDESSRRFNTSRAGKRAGFIDAGRYRCIKICGVKIGEHCLAVLYMTGAWPECQVDHRDLDGLNNRWENLRPATESQNNANKGLSKVNTSGHKGVSYDASRDRWEVAITVDGKKIKIGRFRDLSVAADAYEKAARKSFGEYARTH